MQAEPFGKATHDAQVEVMRQTLRKTLPKNPLSARCKSGFLTDALGSFMFLLIAGGFWLMADYSDAARPAGLSAQADARSGDIQIARVGR